ncbi:MULTISPECIES: nucleoside-diphosphate kinase [Persicobacter]|uniref:Nucleoside diphosphate kinase n=1 Tax=Persicobacter diffluens TaxID=981 RepID=A0AAN4VU80_9BACT|nr:nucleoside-diphosphate kinase [Persicobacter sp. CCB-QB2]GJM59497.1 nucleoside diphosphate kinase [Persicobacter diffluens]
MESGNLTFTMIKPGAVSNEYIGPILSKITEAGFRIAAMKMIKLRTAQAEVFYGIHRDRPFFKSLVEFMTSGPIVVAVLEKENAVEAYRALIGNTNPEEAKSGTIRKLFAESVSKNAVHGSDSDENALNEAMFFFSRSEIFTKDGEVMMAANQIVPR